MANDKVLVHSDYRDDPLKLLDRAHMKYVPWLDAMHQGHRGQDAPDIPITRTGQVEALINSGRCLWVCPACNSVTPVEDRPATTPVGSTGTGATWDLTPTPAHYGHPSICVQCGSDWVDVIFPTNRAAIEAEVMKQPGHRGFAPVRNWQPGWTLEYLQERTTRANELIAAGVGFIRALSIGTPRLWSVGEILTASNMNTYVSDILDDLAGRNGAVQLEDSLEINSAAGRYLQLPGVTTTNLPGTPAAGMLTYDTTVTTPKVRDGSAWRDLLSAADIQRGILAAARGGVGVDASGVAQGGILQGASGGGVFELLALPANGQFLKSNGTKLVGSQSTFQSKLVTFVRSTAGTQAITGAGFAPQAAVVIAAGSGTNNIGPGSIGIVDSAGLERCLRGTLQGTQGVSSLFLTNKIVYIDIGGAGAKSINAVVASMDTDGLTFTWAISGTITVSGAILFIG